MRGKTGRVAVTLLTVLLLGGVAAGCGSDAESGGTAAVDVGAAPAPERGDAPDAEAKRGQATKSAGESRPESGQPAGEQGESAQTLPAQVALQDRKLARNASLSVTTQDLDTAADRARQIAGQSGGYTGKERVRSSSASLDVVVPAESLDATLAELSALGEVSSREQSVEDVTEEAVDVDSRIESQQASVDRVRAMLEKATSVSELASVERELTSRESELESLQARKAALAGRMTTSTISLDLREPHARSAGGDDGGIGGGLADGWQAFVDFGAGVLRAVAVALPFLVLLGIPLAGLAWWWRRRNGRRRAAVVAAPPGRGEQGGGVDPGAGTGADG